LRHIVSEVSMQIALDTPSPDATGAQRAGGWSGAESISTVDADSGVIGRPGLLRRSSVDVG